MWQGYTLALSEFPSLRHISNQQLLTTKTVETHPIRQFGVTCVQTAMMEQVTPDSDAVRQTIQLMLATITNQNNGSSDRAREI